MWYGINLNNIYIVNSLRREGNLEIWDSKCQAYNSLGEKRYLQEDPLIWLCLLQQLTRCLLREADDTTFQKLQKSNPLQLIIWHMACGSNPTGWFLLLFPDQNCYSHQRAVVGKQMVHHFRHNTHP